jgi:transitional endoplasmic reticulum ATPase
MALREDINAKYVAMRHFEEALKKVKPSVTPQMIEYYLKWMETMKQATTQRRERAPQITF